MPSLYRNKASKSNPLRHLLVRRRSLRVRWTTLIRLRLAGFLMVRRWSNRPRRDVVFLPLPSHFAPSYFVKRSGPFLRLTTIYALCSLPLHGLRWKQRPFDGQAACCGCWLPPPLPPRTTLYNGPSLPAYPFPPACTAHGCGGHISSPLVRGGPCCRLVPTEAHVRVGAGGPARKGGNYNYY